MRTVAAVVGIAGALLGALTSAIVILLVFSMMVSVSPFQILPVDLAMLGTEIVAILFCVCGLVGAGLLTARGDQKGIYLMLVAAIGIAVIRLVQPMLTSAVGAFGIPDRFAANPSPLDVGSLTIILPPTIALLLASALGAYAIRARRS